MSRTQKGSKGPGFEYWSRRPFSGHTPGRVTKKMTHKRERAVPVDDPDADRHTERDLERADELAAALYCYHHGPCETCKQSESE